MRFPVTRTSAPKPIPEDVGDTFGAYFTDHMFLMNYQTGKGWYDHRIVPFWTCADASIRLGYPVRSVNF